MHIQRFWLLAVSLAMTSLAVAADEWPMSGGQIENTRRAFSSRITGNTIGRLSPVWEFQTVPDTGNANTAIDAIGSTPVLDENFVYFTSLQGYLFKIDRHTGREIWRRSYLHRNYSAPGSL